MSSKGKGVATDIENCVICLEPISEKAVASPCHHAYDYLCLLNWLEVRQSCPLCTAIIEHIDVVDATSEKVNRHRVEPPRPVSQPPPSSTVSRAQEFLSLRDGSFRRPRRRHITLEPITEDLAILRRRFIYKHHLRSNHIGSNRISRFQNFTPLQFLRDSELQSRARNFIRRELQVFEWIQADNNTEFLLEYCVGILKSMDLKSASGAAEDMLTDFLGRGNARVFLHELHAFLRSPFTNLSHFDSFVQYTMPIPIRFSDTEELALKLGNGDQTEGVQDMATSEAGSSSIGKAGRNVEHGYWRKGPYPREREPGCRAGSYDSYRPNYRKT